MSALQKGSMGLGARLKQVASVGILAATTLIVLGLGLALGLFYLLIRFIHWSWMH